MERAAPEAAVEFRLCLPRFGHCAIGEQRRVRFQRAVIATDPRQDGRMDDLNIVRRIDELADEEHKLERAHTGEPLSESDLERLRAIEVALDQCWDLLRQRRARRHAGTDPDLAAVRPESTVERYQQ